MTTFLYRNPRHLFLVVGVTLALAAAALQGIGRQEDPSITNLFATVVTAYPGAEPARVEALVTEKIEEQLREIPEIDEIRSTSRTGVSVISIELSLYIEESRIEQIWAEVRDALGEAALELPAGVAEPTLDSDRTGAYTTISAIDMAPGLAPQPAVQRRYAEILQDRLRQLSDSKTVRLFGDQREEIKVTVEPDRLASLGLDFSAVASALTQADAKVRAGELRGTSQQFLLEVAGEIETLARIRAIPLAQAADGSLVRLGDIARVEKSFADPATELAIADGSPVVLVAARMENDRQVDQWTAEARAVMASFEAELPASLRHHLLFDQSTYTEARFQDLGVNLGIGVALVIGVLFLTLGWQAAVVVASIIPLAALITLSLMKVVGLPIQQMSVTGLIVALGLLVDAAIVMSDQIKRRLGQGQSTATAVGGAVTRLALPLLASTLTTILAFVPMARLPGPAGDFVGSIAMTVILMLAVSFALALTITPALAGRMFKGSSPDLNGTRGGILQNGIKLPGLGRLFQASIHLSLRHKGLSVLGALVLPLMGFAAFPTLTAQFFPGVDRDQFYVQVKLPGGTAIEETHRLTQEMDMFLRETAGISRVTWVVGESAPAFYYNMQMNRDGDPTFAEALITSVSPEATDGLIPELQRSLDQRFADAQILVRGLVQGPPVAAPVELKLTGPDLAVLRRMGDKVRAVMSEVGAINHTRADLLGGDAKLIFQADEDKVRLAGMTLDDVAGQLEAALSGATGGSLIEASEELPLRVRLAGADRNTMAALRAVQLVPPGTRPASDFPGIPLTALGSFTLVPSDSPITRLDGERVNTVQGFIAPGVLPEEVLREVQEELSARGFTPPPGYRLLLGGDADARAETSANLAATAPFVVTLTVVIIFLTFGSYRLSLLTFVVAGLSMGTSLLALAVFNHPFGIQALIGAIGSIGVSVNAAIIVLTALQADRDAMAGDEDAIARVVIAQSRHIWSTTITTVGGFLPLILAGGGFWPPFATAIAGGVALSVVLAFYFTPPMFAALLRGTQRITPLPAAEAA